jgi:DNA-binding NarL/FixJ family response regulator
MIGDMIRVVLADDHAVVRAGLKAVLGGAKDIEVIARPRTVVKLSRWRSGSTRTSS